MRRRTMLLIAVGVVVFVAISFELALYLSGPGLERDRVFALLRAQARGDAPAMLRDLDGCAASPGCRAQVEQNARRLKGPGKPRILLYESKTSYHLTAKTALARVAWARVYRHGFPVVQCVTVRHHWSFVSGASVSLRRLGTPIGNEASC